MCFYTLCPILDAELYLIIPPFWGRMANNQFIFLEFFFSRWISGFLNHLIFFDYCGHSLLVHLFIPPEMTKIWALSLALGLLPSSVWAQCLTDPIWFLLYSPTASLRSLHTRSCPSPGKLLLQSLFTCHFFTISITYNIFTIIIYNNFLIQVSPFLFLEIIHFKLLFSFHNLILFPCLIISPLKLLFNTLYIHFQNLCYLFSISSLKCKFPESKDIVYSVLCPMHSMHVATTQ